MPAATLRRIGTKALARYQIILLGEQRHIRCKQLAQSCCPNNAAVGVEPATSRSRVQCSNHYTTEPPSLEYAYLSLVCFLLPQLPAKKPPELPYDDCLIIVRYNQLVVY